MMPITQSRQQIHISDKKINIQKYYRNEANLLVFIFHLDYLALNIDELFRKCSIFTLFKKKIVCFISFIYCCEFESKK